MVKYAYGFSIACSVLAMQLLVFINLLHEAFSFNTHELAIYTILSSAVMITLVLKNASYIVLILFLV